MVGYLETRTNEDTRQKVARDYFSTLSSKISQYNNKRAGEWACTADWVYSNANDVYYDTQRYTGGQTNDPRELASRKMFVDSFREQCSGISEEWLERNYKGIIKSATGQNIDATGLFEIFGNKVKEGYASFLAGVVSIGYEIENMLTANSSDDYDDQKRKERQDKFLSSISGKTRTDYFNEYDSFVQKAILGLGDTLPSLLNSAPAFIGAVVSGFTGNPLALGVGRAISSALNFTMEYGSLVQTLRNSGATPEQILLSAGAYAGVSTAIEYNFDKIPQNLLAKPMGQWLRLYKEVEGLGPKVIADSVAKVLGRRVLTAGADWLSETGEEMLQQLAEDWTVNLLSKYRETHGQSALPEWLTATPEEMWNDFLETGKQMGTTQTLLSVGEMLLGLGFDVSLGNIRHITKASKGVEKTKNSILVPTKSVSINSKASAFSPTTSEEGKEQPFSPARVLRMGEEYIPASSEDMSKAMYQSNNGQFMYVDVADDIETSAYENRTIDEAKNVINGLIDENNGHRVSYAYNTDGSIVVDAGDLNAVVSDYIKSNIDSVIGTQETDSGIVVTVDGKNTVFTTDERSGAQEFSQDEHLHGIMEKIKNAKSEEEANEARDLLNRVKDTRTRRAEETARNVSEDTKNYRNAVNDTVNSLYKTKEERKAERDNYKAQEAKIRQTVSETFDNAMKDGKNAGLLKNVTRKKAIDTWTRGSVVVMARLAKAMGKSVSEFGNRINFVYNPEFVQEGKARMGWTEANADGTYTINLTKLADQSTAIHEIGHAFLYMLGSDGYKSIKGFEEAFKDALGKDGGKVGDATHEAFAEALENYVNQNVASNEGIRSVFNSILNALRNFVDAVRDVITQEQIEMFDNLFEKGLNEGWTESDEVNEGKQFKTSPRKTYTNNDFYSDEEINHAKSSDNLNNLYESVIDKLKTTDVYNDIIGFNENIYNPDYVRSESLESLKTLNAHSEAMENFYNLSDERKKEYLMVFKQLMTDKKKFNTRDGFLAPDGTSSELSPMQYVQVHTKEFMQWAEGDWTRGEGKAILGFNGEPELFFHSTPNEFEAFDKTKVNKNKLGYGFYFMEYGLSPEYSRMSNLLVCFLKANNIQEVEGTLWARGSDYIEEYNIIHEGNVDEYKNSTGYYTVNGTDAIHSEDYEYVVVYNPTQIKSAIDNNGDFGIAEKRIRYKTASSYYYDNQVSRNARTEEGNKLDKNISNGLIRTIKDAYGDAVTADYNKDGRMEIHFDSSDALTDFLYFMRTTESQMLAKEAKDSDIDNDATTRFAMFLPHGNIQLIDIFEDSDTEEILESINSVIESRRADAFAQTYADMDDSGEPVRTLVDLYDMYADDYTKNWTRLLHASPNLFDEFVVLKDKVTLGKKWGYGIYHFDNPQASISVMKDILNQDNSEKGYMYSTAVNTGDESKFIHATGDRNELEEYGVGAGVTQEQRNMLDSYAIRKHKTSLNSLMRSFVESDTEDYRNVNGLSWYDIYDKLNEQNDWIDDAQECMDKAYDACVDFIKGKDVSGLSFFYMVQVLFGEDNLMWDAREALSDAGFKGMIIYEDFWGNSASKNTDEYGGIIDPETGIRQLPTEIVIFNPADEVDLKVQTKSAESVNEEVSRDTDKVTADSYMKQQRKYKTAWTEDEIKNTLEGGKFVPNSVLSKNKENKYVKVERVAQNIIATQPKMYELAKEAIDEYLMGINKTFGELSDAELEEVAELWNKKVKEINSDFDIEKSDNMNLLMKRLNAYANDESPERTTSQWLSRYTNIRNGRSNIQQLAVQMQEAGLFNDKVDVDGEKLSSKYTSLNYIADKVGKSKSKNNKRVYIDSFVYENALKEILNNSDDIMSSLGLDTEFAKGDIVEEIESSENYTENRSIKKLLELDLDDDVRDVIQNGRWTGTVASDLAKKYQQQINQRNLQNKTIQELRERRDSLKEKLKEYREKNETLEKENRYMKALEREIARLDDDVVTLTSAYATKKMELELYRTRQQIIKAINSKSGDAVARNNIKGAVRTILGTTRKDVSKGKIAYISDEALASMPNIKNFLENNGYLIANKLTAGVDDMTSSELSMFKNAVKEDRKLSRIEQEKKEADFNEKILSDVNRIVGTMSSSSVAKLTKEDDSKINEVYASLEGGRENLSDTEKANLRQEARSRVLSAKIESILRNKKYGTEETSKKNRRRGTFGDDFTTFSRILRNVSPELYKIVMEDGLNVVTDKKYKMFDERYGRFIDNMKKITNLKSDKDVSKYLKKIMSLQDKLDVIEDRPIDSRLMKSEYFKEILEEDSDRKSVKSDTKYTLQEMFAIYEHSFDEGGLKHLHDGNNITAYEIAWVVDQFENGKYKEYKPVAHEMRRVYGERFPQIYDAVLENENRELKQVDAYSAQMGLDFDSDLSMRFGYVYDDKVTQKKSFTKDRQFGSNKISLNYYSDLRKVIEMQEGYIAGASFFREMDRLFDSRGGNLKNIITEMYDERTSDRIEQMLDICKNDVVVGNRMTEADGLVSTVRNHYVMARLAYNFSSVLQQLASWGLGFTKYGVGRMWKTTMQFLMHPIKMNNLVYELSPQMRRNVNPLLEMAKETMSKNPDSVAGKINDALSSVGSKGLVLMEKLDHIVRNTLWYASYQAELDEMYSEKKTKELSASDLDLAQRRATQWVMDIQSSSQAKDNALVYAKGDAIWKQLLMFTNQLNKEWNVLWNDAIKNGLLKKDIGKFFANFAGLSIATMWVVLSTGKLKNNEDDDETWIEDLLQDFGTEFISRAPVIGQTAKNALEGFTYEQTDDPITRTIELIKRLAEGDSDKTKTAVRNEVWSLLDIFGAPTTAVKRTYRTFEGGDFLQGDHIMRMLGGEWYKYFE